eukprot:7222873-Lingulodinium_polyedra.AAC.1
MERPVGPSAERHGIQPSGTPCRRGSNGQAPSGAPEGVWTPCPASCAARSGSPSRWLGARS